MFIVIPTTIKLLERPNHQTIAYHRQVTEWLKQWTVPNNYSPYLANDATGVEVVKELLVEKLVSDLRNALSSVARGTLREHAANFMFTYQLWEAVPNDAAKFIRNQSFYGDDAVPAEDIEDAEAIE